MKHIIIGTAGHIDHGKTTLIKALTGRNTDRWEEEQRRGITIDLGFTWFDLPGGDRAGIIDVPGHERFINNMVAGVVGMDMVLLVVAADEGIMPQTREHMDILSLLGIEKSIIVLNKCDLVDEEWTELVEEEIREELAGSFLEKAPIVRVSAATGAGLKELVDIIEKIAEEEVVEKDTATIPRLPIDRAFSLSGFGTIITGTLLSGTITKEDVLEMYPKQDTKHSGARSGCGQMLCRSAGCHQPFQYQKKRNRKGLCPGASGKYEKYRPSGCEDEYSGFFYAGADKPYQTASFYRNK